MAGFVGHTGKSIDASDAVKNALGLTLYSAKTAIQMLHESDDLVLGKSVFDFLQTTRSVSQEESISVWVDGEIYNQEQLSGGLKEVFADTLLRHYQQQSLSQLLPQVNGIYVAIIYDGFMHTLTIVTDRYGLRPLFLTHKSKQLVFAAELKCFQVFPSVSLEVDQEVIDCFLDLEHFLGTDTWFKGIEAASPATVYTYNIDSDVLKQQRYWSWSDLKPAKISLTEAAHQMGDLLHEVVNDRFDRTQNVGIGLSGGLDSRALVAAVHEKKPVTYTFGTPNSRDVKIAKEVARVAGVRHVLFDTYSADWLTSRFSGIWKVDGMLNMLHMHYSHLTKEIATIMDINLSGFLGDAMLGGSYLGKKGKTFLNKRVDKSIAQHFYGRHYERCDPGDPFFDIEKIDPYMLYNRGRRMIGLGAEEPAKTIPQRLPFMDTALMDLSFSLPDDYRAHSKVYNKALLEKYPVFYKNIPNSNIGVPIAENPSITNLLLKKYYRISWIINYKLGRQTSYANAQNWIRQPQTARLLYNILDPAKAIYPAFTRKNFLQMYLVPHLNRRANFVRQIMGAVTAEIWFQQMLNKNYVPERDWE